MKVGTLLTPVILTYFPWVPAFERDELRNCTFVDSNSVTTLFLSLQWTFSCSLCLCNLSSVNLVTF